MIVEKPTWLRHAGLQIFSVDTQPNGFRFATAGGDHKVRIWNMKALDDSEADLSAHKLLATLRDHFGSVNCVRWAKCGRLIASGSDDHIVLVHEKRPGSGTTEFGSGEPPDVENWKVLLTLRGHTADVVDLGWSPDDSQLASCSLDNTVRIWQASTGSTIAILTGHQSLVKGLAWDPIGSFIASQSDDKSVIIWRTSNWGMVRRVEGPWEKTVGSTFFRRLGWSPCGHFIASTHGFQNPSHTAPVLERGEWLASFDFVGHIAPVVAVRFNHSMFRKVNQGSVDGAANGTGAGVTLNGASAKSKESLPYNVIAIGSQDCCISVWTTGSPRPVFIGKHFFQQSVVDLSWSPDGYTLFCCSLDGSVATFQFETKELGQRISDAEMEEFKKSRYGDVRVRQATVAESPAQLLLEAAAAKQWGSTKTDSAKTSAPSIASNGLVAPEVPATKPVGAPEAAIKNGGLITNTTVSSKVAPSPVKQTEYRRADGRRRIIPEPLGNGVIHGNSKYDAPNSRKQHVGDERRDDFVPVVERVGGGSDSNLKRSLPEECVKADIPPAKRSNGTVLDDACAPAARSSRAETITISAINEGQGGGTQQQVDMVIPAEKSTALDGVLSIRIRAPEEIFGEEGSRRALPPLCLEAKPAAELGSDNRGGSVLGSAEINLVRESSAKAKIVCSQGGDVQWCDCLPSMPTALAGNSNFWAVACGDGSLQIYTMAGRRAQPAILLGSAAAFMDCDDSWKLLVVTRGGTLHVWDLQEWKRLIHESLSPLLSLTSTSTSTSLSTGTMKVVTARLSKSGAPLIVLANRHAFVFHLTMCCWLRIADDSFPASHFVTTWPDTANSANNGELASLQAGVARAAGPSFLWNRTTLSEEKWQTRVHLEVQMSSALALKSSTEYQRCLLSYARCLAKDTDEARLREVCEELLGPIRVDYSMSSSPSNPVNNQKQWNSEILGLNKRQLLREVVLPAMASNRAIQRLLNEFVDLLSECEAAQQASGQDEVQF